MMKQRRGPLWCTCEVHFTPLVTNGLSHPYHLDESTLILRDTRCYFSFLFHFSMKRNKANRIAPDGTPRFAASHLGLFCLPMSNKKDVRLIWVNKMLSKSNFTSPNYSYQPRKEKHVYALCEYNFAIQPHNRAV